MINYFTSATSLIKATSPTILLYILIHLFLTGLLFLEAFFYPGFLLRYFGINQQTVAIMGLVVIALAHFIFRFSLPEKIRFYLYFIITPIVCAVALLLNLAESFLYTNFCFNTFHLHPEPLQIISYFFFGLALININIHEIKQRFELALFSTSVFVLSNLVFFQWETASTLFWQLKKEDGAFEYLTASLFFLSSFLMFKNFRAVKQLELVKPEKNILLSIFVLASIVLFMIGAEEISWGQRILGIETPEYIAEHNAQEEITLHNSKVLGDLVYDGYWLLSLCGMTAWLIKKLLKRYLPSRLHSFFDFFIPNWYYMFYFLPSFIYTMGRDRYGYIVVGDWEETTEMILSIGILFFVLETHIHKLKMIKPLLQKKSKDS